MLDPVVIDGSNAGTLAPGDRIAHTWGRVCGYHVTGACTVDLVLGGIAIRLLTAVAATAPSLLVMPRGYGLRVTVAPGGTATLVLAPSGD